MAPAWPYAAGHRHLGHVAGFGVPSDAFARYHRLKGNDVLMVSGTDEHGTPVMVAADREGKSYARSRDYYNQSFREDFRRLGLSYDLFSRTTTLNHERVTQDLFRTLYEHGAIIEQTMLVSFSPATGHTLPDRYIEGTCPICGYPEARGDQCDNCGNQLDPIDLIDPRSRIDGSTPEFRETKHLFLDLPQFADTLRTWIEGQGGLAAERARTSRSACSTRSGPARSPATSTGACAIPIPGYAEDRTSGSTSGSTRSSATYRRASSGRRSRATRRLAHVVAEPRRVPCVLPGEGQHRLPHRDLAGDAARLRHRRRVRGRASRRSSCRTTSFATEFLTMEGKQFSTSRGTSIFVRDFLDRYDPDPLRYYLVAAGPESQDTDFTWAEFVRRNNDELLANWGNLVNRTLTNAHRNFGAVPEPGELDGRRRALLAAVDGGFDERR